MPIAGARILLVEDEMSEATLATEALRALSPHLSVHHVKRAEDACAFVRRQDPYDNAPPIDLVLLDLNLPGRNGLYVLKELRADDTARHVPIVVLSTSAHPRDVRGAYKLGASGYIQKPFEYQQFVRSLKTTCEFWLETCLHV